MADQNCGLTDADRADLHARLASWFGDERQAFLVSHLMPVVDRIKNDAYIAGLAAGIEQRAGEFQAAALEMAFKADAAERRAEDAEAAAERNYAAFVGAEALLARLMAAADTVGHAAACMVDPCECWMQDLVPLLPHAMPQWELARECQQGTEDDAWTVAVYREKVSGTE